MPITIDAGYPGGNIIVEQVDGDRIVVRQDIRDTSEWWFWWSFRLRGAAGRTVRVEFNDKLGPVSMMGPAVSRNRIDWAWTDQEHDFHHFVYHVPADAEEIYFAFSFPYQLADFQRFIAARQARDDFHTRTLNATRHGRPSPLVTIGNPDAASRNVLFTARHHACECVANYVLEGVIDYILSGEADALRGSTAFSIVPFVDLDGVEEGDQGKARRPHDHNRDYNLEPLYPTVAAIETLAARLAARRLALYVDFHCPWIRGGGNDAVFFPDPPEPFLSRLNGFKEILRRENDSPLPYTGLHDVPYGTSWNVPTPDLVSSGRYMRENFPDGLLFATTLETSYALAEGATVTPDAARHLGRCFGRSLHRYLETQG